MKTMPQIKKDIEKICPQLPDEKVLELVGYIRDIRNAAFKAKGKQG